MCLPFAAVGVYLDVDGLPWPHMSKLRFLKVGRNPDIVDRHYFYQFLPPADILAPGHRLGLPWRGSSKSVAVRSERCVNRLSPAKAFLVPGALPVQPPVH